MGFQKVCGCCGISFVAKGTRAKYCSVKCRHQRTQADFTPWDKGEESFLFEQQGRVTQTELIRLVQDYQKEHGLTVKNGAAIMSKLARLGRKYGIVIRSRKGKVGFQKVCEFCGTDFIGVRSSSRFCSNRCRGKGREATYLNKWTEGEVQYLLDHHKDLSLSALTRGLQEYQQRHGLKVKNRFAVRAKLDKLIVKVEEPKPEPQSTPIFAAEPDLSSIEAATKRLVDSPPVITDLKASRDEVIELIRQTHSMTLVASMLGVEREVISEIVKQIPREAKKLDQQKGDHS